ncbi:MAG: DUF4157 domain-containing protein [Anaerolineales bacterium]|nr:DUF4157 domain-containing protein [Anaerolineales bacterium]
MSHEQAFDDKQKIKPQPTAKTPDGASAPLTLAQMQRKLDHDTVTQMQQTVGNTAVQRFLAQRSGGGPLEVEDDVAHTINGRRGQGSALDESLAAKAGQVMGQDFSGVRVHTDNHADQLSQQLQAKAFTTGSDIFFRQGEYNPGSAAGQHLISHELTHVAQQGGTAPVQAKMTVNDPNDQYEVEADRVADMVMSQTETAVQRQGDIPEEEELLQRQEVEEDEEMLQA